LSNQATVLHSRRAYGSTGVALDAFTEMVFGPRCG
jgi:hypothetical protein